MSPRIQEGRTPGRILVPLDGSGLSAAILPWVAGFARRLGAELHLLTVLHQGNGPVGTLVDHGRLIEFQPAMRGANGSNPRDEVRGEFEAALVAVADLPGERAEGRLQRIASGLNSTGVAVSTSVVSGDPPTEIIRAAHETGSDLIAMATHGRVGIGRGLLGSTTDRVIHASDLPLLTVRPDAIRRDTERASARFPSVVLAALDGSELAEGCLGPAAAIARRLEIDLRLVRAHEAPGGGIGGSIGPVTVARRQLREEARHYLERKAAALREDGASVAIDVVAGPADRALLRVGRRWQDSLLVVGTRGRSGLTRWVLGSVTDKVVRSAGRPVLVIPPRFS